LTPDTGVQIIKKAKELGATLAGITSVVQLRESPSHKMLSKFGTLIDGIYSFEQITEYHEIKWPTNARSALVIAISNPKDKPELDWSIASGNTQGNKLLISINTE
jgi:hypothetical protein